VTGVDTESHKNKQTGACCWLEKTNDMQALQQPLFTVTVKSSTLSWTMTAYLSRMYMAMPPPCLFLSSQNGKV